MPTKKTAKKTTKKKTTAKKTSTQPMKQTNNTTNNSSGSQTKKDRVAAGVLAILLGALGVHHFYLGNVGLGILYICISWTGISAIAGIIEGIIYLTYTDEEFQQKYGKR